MKTRLTPGISHRRHFLRQGGCLGAAVMAGVLAKFPCTGAPSPSRVRWNRETIYRGTDPLSGAKVWQLTSAAIITHNIYGEQLYCSADGNRVGLLRNHTTDHRDGPMDLCVADLRNQSVLTIGPAAFFLVAGCGERNLLYYVRRDAGDVPRITRLNLVTLEQTDVFAFGECPPPEFRGLLAVSPDDRHVMILRRLGGRRYGIERIDLVTGTWRQIHEADDIFNAHLQFNPAGNDLMVQHNRGGILDESFNVIRSVGPEGATLYVIDSDGGNLRRLPVGTPHTTPVTGHECWLGRTGRLLLTTRGGKVYTVGPGEAEPTLVTARPGFNHITASPDGRFFVVDDFSTGRLYVGCLATRRVLPFCDSGASCGSPQYTHTHPYITPGNRHVIYNSDRTGVPQVYAAEIPGDLLAKLESGAGE